jgi:DNA-binding transcriptional regulator YiaG
MRSGYGIEAMDQTAPYQAITSKAVLSVPITILLTIGTGGATTVARVELLKERDSGFGIHRRHVASDNGPTAEEAISAAQDIVFIRSILKVSTAELAKCIGVTRQSLYNWKAGSTIKDKNAELVHQLKAAATLIAQEGMNSTAHALRRTMPGGKTLLEMIGSGGDGRVSAQALITMLRDERAVQRTLAERFSGRKAPPDPDHSFKELG